MSPTVFFILVFAWASLVVVAVGVTVGRALERALEAEAAAKLNGRAPNLANLATIKDELASDAPLYTAQFTVRP